jgi:acyl carrier protein phosphodiesterase
MVPPMNFLAHLLLAGNDEGLRLGAMLGDFVRGGMDDSTLPAEVQRGIQLHRFIDQYVDGLPELARLRQSFQTPFRRYAGIIIDVAFDHELARHWSDYSNISLQQFDQEVRDLLGSHNQLLPEELKGFMRYVERRGLFAAYQDKTEILHSLAGIGQRLSRTNPLHRVNEIWDEHEQDFASSFLQVFPQVRDAVSKWTINNERPDTGPGEKDAAQRCA